MSARAGRACPGLNGAAWPPSRWAGAAVPAVPPTPIYRTGLAR